MARNTCMIVVTGNLTRDPRIVDEQTYFTIAINGFLWDSEARRNVEHTTYFDVATFRQTARNCADILNKGQKVLVYGRLTIKPPRQGTNGRWYTDAEIHATDVEFLTPRAQAPAGADAAGGSSPGPAPAGGAPAAGGDDWDIPF